MRRDFKQRMQGCVHLFHFMPTVMRCAFALHSFNAECINAATIGPPILFDSVRALTKPRKSSQPSCPTYRKDYRGTIVDIMIYCSNH